MLIYLLYTSTRTKKCTQTEIDKILTVCNQHNLAENITGVLLYSENKFVQYLEGEYTILTSLYDKIKEDDRHQKVRLMAVGMIEQRAFPSWHMGNKKLSWQEIDFVTEMTNDEKASFDAIIANETKQGEKIQRVLQALF